LAKPLWKEELSRKVLKTLPAIAADRGASPRSWNSSMNPSTMPCPSGVCRITGVTAAAYSAGFEAASECMATSQPGPAAAVRKMVIPVRATEVPTSARVSRSMSASAPTNRISPSGFRPPGSDRFTGLSRA